MIKSYFEQIQEQYEGIDVPLERVFTMAGCPRSTYFRTVKGKTNLSLESAIKISNMIAMIKKGRTRSRNDKRQL